MSSPFAGVSFGSPSADVSFRSPSADVSFRAKRGICISLANGENADSSPRSVPLGMTSRFLARGVALALACLLLAPGAGAQTTEAGTAKLVEVKVVGSKRFPEAAIVAASGLQAGQDVTREEMQAAADKLSTLGYFHNVRYNFRSIEGETSSRVEMTLQIEDAPTVPVYFDNFPWFTDDELMQALREALPLFDGTIPEAGRAVEMATEAIQKQLPGRKIEGTVERELSGQVVGDGMMMRFILKGPLLKVEGLRMDEPIVAQNKAIAAEARELAGKLFSRFTVELFLQEHVRPVYWERGHLRVRFAPPQARFTGDPRKPLADSVLVIVPIEPGPVYRWGGVTWTGNAAFGPAALDAFVLLPAGLPANGNQVEETWQRIEQEYGRRGYIEMRLRATPAFDETNLRVHYTVKMDEGRAYRMGELVLTGLSPLASRKLTEAWTLEKGAVFDAKYLEDFLAACRSKKVFGDYVIHYDEVGHMLQPNPETRTVDVMIDFK